jgi:hypothetical protein
MRGLRGIAAVVGIAGLVALGLGVVVDRHGGPSPSPTPAPTPSLGSGSKRYFSPNGRFSIAAPGDAVERTLRVKTLWGRSIFYDTEFVPDIPKDMFHVYWVDVPLDVLARSGAKRVLRMFRAGALQRYHGRIVKDAPVTVNGYPGRDLFVNFGRFRIARIRTCLAGTRFYQVVVVSVRSFVHPDRVRALRFLWSFRVVGAVQFV